MSDKVHTKFAELEAELSELRRENASLKTQVSELNELAQRDPLTGIGNRRAFEHRLEVELNRTWRSRCPTCLMLFDIDRLKSVNDSLGHAAGDAVISGLARLLDASTRSLDSVFRIGGDEFAIVLSASGIESGMKVSDRILRASNTGMQWQGENISTSAAVGMASISIDGMGKSELLILDTRTLKKVDEGFRGGKAEAFGALMNAADKALYAEKARGSDV